MSDDFLRHVPDSPSEDINILPSEGHGQLHEADTQEVLDMVLGDEEDLVFGDEEQDVVFGRMPVGGAGDPSEFDAGMPYRHMDLGVDGEGEDGDEIDLMAGDDEAADMFESPSEETFPLYRAALRQHRSSELKPKTLRVDTHDSHDQFMCERAIKEIERKVNDLSEAMRLHDASLDAHHDLLEAHNTNPSAHSAAFHTHDRMDILGAAETVSKLSSATNAKEAADALPQVPLDLPSYAEGKVKCWKDGKDIVCSMRFAAADGTVRVATMAARPRIDGDDAARYALQNGVDPVTLLGALSDLADVACGKKLVKEVAGAALAAHNRLDVCGMAKDGTDDPSLGEEPLFLKRHGKAGMAPVAALMHVERLAGEGHLHAKKELAAIRKAATTVHGAELMPLLDAASERLKEAKRAETKKPTLAQKHAIMGMYL